MKIYNFLKIFYFNFCDFFVLVFFVILHAQIPDTRSRDTAPELEAENFSGRVPETRKTEHV